MFEWIRKIFRRASVDKQIKVENTKFNFWQDVWMIKNNKPRKVKIVCVMIYSIYEGQDKNVIPEITYRVADIDCAVERQFGISVRERDLYESKQELIDKFASQ